MDASRIKALADEIRDEPSGQLPLATTQTQARYVLPPVIDCFRRRFSRRRIPQNRQNRDTQRL